METIKNIEYVCLGFCGNDRICIVPEIPLDGKVRIIRHFIQGGGPAGTAAVAAARLGLRTAIASVAGNDADGRKIVHDFEAEHVDTHNLLLRENAESPVAYCWIDEPTGNRSVAWTPGNAAELAPDELDFDMIRKAKMLHLDGHDPIAALAAAHEANEAGVPVNFDAGTVRPGVEALVPLADILFASEDFARKWTKENDLETAVRKLAADSRGKAVGLTMGKKGSLAVIGGKVVHVPAFEIRAVDTTGAGDVFHTGFAVRYLECGDVAESMRFGSAVSAIKCLQAGGRTGIPSRSEVDAFLRAHK